MKGWKKAAREGVRINANRKEIHRRNGSNPVGASRTGDQSRFFGTKTKKKIQKKIFSRYPLLGSLFSNGIPVPVCLCLRVSFLPPSLPLLSLALALCSRSPLSLTLSLSLSSPPYSLSPCSSLRRPLPPPSRLPRLGSRASPLSSARGSAPRLPGGRRRGARERGGAATLCSSGGSDSPVMEATPEWRWRPRTLA